MQKKIVWKLKQNIFDISFDWQFHFDWISGKYDRLRMILA